MNIFSRINSWRPWQLFGLIAVVLAVGLALLANMPAKIESLPWWQQKVVEAHWRTWLVLWLVCLGLAVDMVVNYRSRPGAAKDPEERRWREMRRAVTIAAIVLAGAIGI